MVLHLLDQGAGGEGTLFVGDLIKEQDPTVSDEVYLGNARVDVAIGGAWPARAKELREKINRTVDPAVFDKTKMNVTLMTVLT